MLTCSTTPAPHFSSAFRVTRSLPSSQLKFSRLEAKGYSPVEAKVRFQVYWRYDESSGTSQEPQWREALVLLPDLLLAVLSENQGEA